jgi:hemerythrin
MGITPVSGEETKRMLDFLGEYVVKHFGDEEALQKQSGYPKYEWHKSQHLLFICEFDKLRREFEANGATPDFILKLNTSVTNWIVRHIKSVDVEFGKYYQHRLHVLIGGGKCAT